MVRFGAAALLFLVGCLEPQLVLCGDGRACPIGTTCQLALETCVTDEQLAACSGIENGETCELDADPGTCVEGACFLPRCGDRILEQGEACDDGNFTSGDGCSADCRSDEVCGDGIFEPELGEICDDGNNASGDGCSSLCEQEELAWRVRQCGAPAMTSYGQYEDSATYDQKRGRLVLFDRLWLWEWDGTKWECFSVPQRLDGYDRYTNGLVYDPVRELVLSFESDAIYAWDGATWTVHGPADQYSGVALAYDSTRDEFVVYSSVASQSVHIWSPITKEWSEVAVTSTERPTDFYASAAYNPTTDQLVMVSNGFGPTTPADTWVWSRTSATWTRYPQTWPPERGVSVTYHPTLGIVAFGGYDDTFQSTLYTWNGSTWNVVATTNEPYVGRENPVFVYDSKTAALLATGGVGSSTDVVTFQNGAWTRWQPTGLLESEVSAIVSHPPDRTLLAIDSYGATFRYDGTGWSKVTTTVLAPPIVVYRPDTQRVVGWSSSRGLLEWDGNDWVLVASDTRSPTPDSIAWDPTRGLVMYDLEGAWVRTASGWEKFADPIPSNYAGRLAYDYRANRLTLTTKHVILNETTAFARVGDEWQRVFTFGYTDQFSLRELSARGTVLFITPTGGDAWEFVDDSWRRHGGPRASSSVPASGVDLMRGEVLLVGYGFRNLLALGYTNDTPRESCIDGEDSDGDGASGCDDDECWWRCAPTCPPFSTCF